MISAIVNWLRAYSLHR